MIPTMKNNIDEKISKIKPNSCVKVASDSTK